MAAGRIAKLAALLCLVPPPAFAGATRPDPLAGQANCDSYRGTTIGANDATQLFELRVCPSATGVVATLQSSSLVSGSSLRASEGSWDPAGKTLTLVETRFLDSRPEPGWHFCLIDALVLDKTATGLEGTYVSEACDDRATLKFDAMASSPGSSLVGSPVPPSVGSAAPMQPVTPEPPASSDDRSSTCACQSGEDQRPSPMLLSLLLMAGLLGARGRSRLRSSAG